MSEAVRTKVEEALKAKGITADFTLKNPRRIYLQIDPADLVGAARAIFDLPGVRFQIATGQQTPRGFEVLHQYTIIPALWLKGSPRAIDALSAYEGTVWIEYNEELEWLIGHKEAEIALVKNFLAGRSPLDPGRLQASCPSTSLGGLRSKEKADAKADVSDRE